MTIVILSFPGSWNELSHFIRLHPGPCTDHPDQGRRTALLRTAQRGNPVPAKAGRCRDHDHPRRHHLLHLPKTDHERHGRSRQGIAAGPVRRLATPGQERGAGLAGRWLKPNSLKVSGDHVQPAPTEQTRTHLIPELVLTPLRQRMEARTDASHHIQNLLSGVARLP